MVGPDQIVAWAGEFFDAFPDAGIPRLSQAPGFVAAQWVRLDETTGTSMLTFESEEAARAAAEMLRTNPPGGSAITINSIEVGEVVERV